MISRRLTKAQKEEILIAYRGGENTNTLAGKYSCTPNTINRTVKKLLTDNEYKLLKEKRLKSSNKKGGMVDNKIFDFNQDDFENLNPIQSSKVKNKEEEQSINSADNFLNTEFQEIDFLPMGEKSPSELQDNENSDIEKTNQDLDNNFEEIVPLLSSLDFEKERIDFELLNQENLPESVYMIVDKKVELDVKSISHLPEWSFLPEDELKRNAILLFANQRNAKRSCSRNQRVIKIPNTSVFEVSKTHLISKGITRLILEDSIICLDN